MNLIEYIRQSINFNPELLKVLETSIHTEGHPKGKMILKEGQRCQKIYFVEKGCLRFFYYDESGKEVTHWFILENEFITEIDSLFSQSPSEFFIETLENSILQTFSPEEFFRISYNHSELSRFKDMLMMKTIVELGEKIKDLQFRDAKTRYDNLVNKYPDILLRVPLGYIASYLGITQPSLSRIRRQR